MKISMKGKYALLLMMDLAEKDGGDPVSLKDIAARQEISEKYLEQVVALLNKGGLVRSVRGSQGGYRLLKKPFDYTVGEILRVTEGNMALSIGEDDAACNALWEKIDNAVGDVVNNVTLEDMLSWKHESMYDYCI